MTERETPRRNEVTGRPWAADELFLLDRGNESRQNGGDARFQDAALELHNLRAALAAEVTQREAAERRVRQLEQLAAAVYQMAGCADAPERFLDALGAAQAGEPLPDDPIDVLLPVSPDEFTALADATGRADTLTAALANVTRERDALKAQAHHA